MDLMMMMMMVVVVLVCAETEKVTEVRGELGTDVTLNCSIRDGNVFWSMMIHSQLKVQIGRTYSFLPEYNAPEYETKYLIQENRLMIKNMTAEDCRLYFCGRKKSGNMVSVDAFRLISDVPVTPTTTPLVTLTTHSNHHNTTHWLTDSAVLMSSFALNGVLVLLIGVICVCWRMKSSRCRKKNPPDFSLENPEMLETPQYEEIQLPPPRSECIYYKAQHPLPRC
ncbi:uncharacterized protein LOC121635308 [Melanotaenia boesemani]|uniref:uncharacterized protein LOC121635308 n=1 Tax=Melanotaenia boesemani TaxID=1250792 RepID=UPI001C043932|nr:uncharacterized protein LOC121635308 [Melanotaenia boesemani]